MAPCLRASTQTIAARRPRLPEAGSESPPGIDFSVPSPVWQPHYRGRPCSSGSSPHAPSVPHPPFAGFDHTPDRQVEGAGEQKNESPCAGTRHDRMQPYLISNGVANAHRTRFAVGTGFTTGAPSGTPAGVVRICAPRWAWLAWLTVLRTGLLACSVPAPGARRQCSGATTKNVALNSVSGRW